MTHRILAEYLDSLRPHLRQLPLREQREVIAQVREHLEEDVRARRGADQALSPDEAAIQATAAFGDPQDIGVAYGSGGGVVRKSTGEVLLHVAVLAGRGVAGTVRKTLLWTSVGAAFLLVLGTVIFLTLAIAYQPTVEKGLEEAASYQDRPLVARSGSVRAATAVFTDTFSISERTVSSTLQVVVNPTGGAQSGCMTVSIIGPQATRLYDSTGDCGRQDFRGSFTEPGTYTIEYRQAAFTGSYLVHGSATDRVQP